MNDSGSEFKLHFLDYWRVIRVRFPIILLTFILVVATAGVVTYFMPKKYEAKVTLEVRDNSFLPVLRGGQEQMTVDPRVATTQFHIIRERAILDPVIDKLDLVKNWGEEYGVQTKQQAFELLRNMLDVQEVRNTALLEISVLNQSPQQAALLANAIAEEYQNERVEQQEEWVKKSLGTFRDEVGKRRNEVDALRDRMQKIRVEKGIVDLNPESVEDPFVADTQVLLQMEQRVSEERNLVSELRSRYEQVSRLNDDELIRNVSTLQIDDPVISQFMPQYMETASEEARLLNSGLGVNHPQVRSIREKKTVYSNQLTEQAASLRKTLETNLQIAERQLEKMITRLDELRTGQTDLRIKNTEYVSAKSDYIQAKEQLEQADAAMQLEVMQRILPLKPAQIWSRAQVPERPSRPRVLLNLALGVIVGLVMGVGLAFFIEYLDTSVKTMEDVESLLGVPVLAVIKRNIKVLLHESPDHPDAEAYRILRTNIEFNRKSPDANTITMISGGTGEGKSTTLVNLAYTFAAGGYQTLIVDADLRRPSQHNFFDVENDFGLTDFLTTNLDLEQVVRTTELENLYLLPSGRLPMDAVGILNSQRMIDLINEVKARFDIVFFDSPPILGVSDASVLASALDLSVIVVQHRRFPRAMLTRVKTAVTNVGGNILGVVLNNVDVKHDQHYEYYTSYYNYYSTAPDKPSKKKPKKSGQTADAGAHEDY